MQVDHCPQQSMADRDARLTSRNAIGIVLLGMMLSACARTLPAEVTQSFEMAFSRNDLPGCMALFADDAQILPEHGEVIIGKPGIESFLKNQMTPVVSFNTVSTMTLVRGDIGIDQGQFKVRDVRHGADIELGKYIHIWKKIKGDWKLYRIIYNTDVAPRGEVSVGDPVPEEGYPN
ncbi:MAG: DUF3225 domain-containing protein [Polyangiaceae bacterium]